MRIRLHLCPASGSLLPLNYQYPVAAWIYQTIARSDSRLAEVIHERVQRNRFPTPPFNFSRIYAPHSHRRGDRLLLYDLPCHLDLSFPDPHIATAFLAGLGTRSFSIGDRFSRAIFRLVQVENLPVPTFQNYMEYHLLSPLVVQLQTPGGKKYLHPEDFRFAELLTRSLARHYPTEPTIPESNFRLLNRPRSYLIHLKPHSREWTKIKAYQFRFGMSCPVEWHATAYRTGWGSHNAMGFGCVRVLTASPSPPPTAGPHHPPFTASNQNSLPARGLIDR